MQPAGVHHIEIWLADAADLDGPWAWLLPELAYAPADSWPTGRIWQHGNAYIVLEADPAVGAAAHDRMRPGFNHIAFWAGTTRQVDRPAATAEQHGWRLLFPDRHPFAGGPGTYAAYLENAAGFEVELVASDPPAGR